MSWIFGYRRPDPPPQDFSQFIPQPAPGDGGSGDAPPPGKTLSKSQMEAYRFDSSALERAAQAAKTLERSGTIEFFLSSIFISRSSVLCNIT